MKKGKDKSDIVVQGLMDYLSDSGQTNLLPEVAQDLQNLLKEASKEEQILVESYIPLTPDQKEELGRIMKKFIGKNLPITNKINHNLLGGFTLQVGDWFLDASLAHSLENIKNKLLS